MLGKSSAGWLLRAVAVLLACTAVALSSVNCTGSGNGAGGGGNLLVLRTDGARRDTGRPTVWVEIAASRAERRDGLMGRKTLAPDAGMLFVYATPARREFWMKDCHLALDIAFIGEDFRILEVATCGPGVGLPYDEIPRAVCEAPVAFVLETNAGWFAERGVVAGQRVDLGLAIQGVRPD